MTLITLKANIPFTFLVVSPRCGMVDGHTRLSILLVGHRQLTRQALASLLEHDPEVRVLGEAASMEEAIRVAKQSPPNLVLIQGRAPGIDLGTLRQKLAEEGAGEARIVMLTGRLDPADVVSWLGEGVAGFLSPRTSGATLLSALRSINLGLSVFEPEAIANVIREFSRNGTAQSARDPSVTAGLTMRELQVLDLLRGGQSNKEIGASLGIGIRTVEMHVAHIMAKLSSRSRMELITRVVRTPEAVLVKHLSLDP